jgi:hypothetical protein
VSPFWKKKRPVSPSPEAQKTFELAVELKAKQKVHTEQWEHHLHTNGFAELLEALMIKSAHRSKEE